jgi:molecular chaperone GrpE
MYDEVKEVSIRQNRDGETEKPAEAPAGSIENQAEEPVSPAIDKTVVEEFERELAEARRQADENHDRYLRAVAELENVRKRLEKTYQERVVQVRRELLRRFLEVADNLERALKAAQEGGDIVEGVQLTYHQLQRLITQQGVEPIEAIGQPFDPLKHEAISIVSVDGVEDETIVAEEQRGYTHQGELLRPSRVYVAKKIENEATSHEV